MLKLLQAVLIAVLFSVPGWCADFWCLEGESYWVYLSADLSLAEMWLVGLDLGEKDEFVSLLVNTDNAYMVIAAPEYECYIDTEARWDVPVIIMYFSSTRAPEAGYEGEAGSLRPGEPYVFMEARWYDSWREAWDRDLPRWATWRNDRLWESAVGRVKGPVYSVPPDWDGMPAVGEDDRDYIIEFEPWAKPYE